MKESCTTVFSRGSLTEQKTGVDSIALGPAEKLSHSAQQQGPFSTSAFLDNATPSCFVSSCRASDKELGTRTSSLPRALSSVSESIRSISWLRRLMFDFLSDMSKRPVFAIKPYASVHEYQDSAMITLRSSHETSSTSASLATSLDLRLALLSFLRAKWSTEALLRKVAVDLLRAIQHYRNYDIEVQLFSSLLSCKKYDGMDNKLFVQTWAQLLHFPHLSRADGHRTIPAGQLWPCARACLSASCLPRDVRARTLNRVKNAIDRWFCESPRGALALPETNGQPFLFSLPYALRALRLYIGASVPAPHGAAVAPRAVEKEPVTGAHVLALILLNAKMERMSPAAQKRAVAEDAKKRRLVEGGVPGEQNVQGMDARSWFAESDQGFGSEEKGEEGREAEKEHDDEEERGIKEVDSWLSEVKSNEVGNTHPYFDEEAQVIDSKSNVLFSAQTVDDFSLHKENTDFQKEVDEFGKRMDKAFEHYEKVQASHPI